MAGMKKWGLAMLALGVWIAGCAGTSAVVKKYQIKSQSDYPSAIRIGEKLDFQALAINPEGEQLKSPKKVNIPTWLVDNPENCRVEPRKGMKATLEGVAAGPCKLWLRAKVKVGLNEIEAWDGEITE